MFSIYHTRWLPYKSLGAWSSPKFYRSNVTRVFNFVLDSIFFFLFLFNLILIPSVFDYSMFKFKILLFQFERFNPRELRVKKFSILWRYRVMNFSKKPEKEFSTYPLFFLSICTAILNFVSFFAHVLLYIVCWKNI